MEKDLELLWQKAAAFHGHVCPGLAIGFKACEAAMKVMGVTGSKDEELVCITENDACGVDAIQAVLGCAFRKKALSTLPLHLLLSQKYRSPVSPVPLS